MKKGKHSNYNENDWKEYGTENERISKCTFRYVK